MHHKYLQGLFCATHKLGIILCLAGAGCHHDAEAQNTLSTVFWSKAGLERRDEPTMLRIHGFNYTDLAIENFWVAGQWGGNLAVSSPHGGGGGTVCCLPWRPGTKLPVPIDLKWERYVAGQWRSCRTTGMLNGPAPVNPTGIGVHFLLDGRIEVELSEGEPRLRYRFDNFDDGHRKGVGNVIHDEKTSECKNGR